MVAHMATPSATAGPPGRRIARARATASADEVAPVPTQTRRVTPASDARAIVAASRSAWGSTGPSPSGDPNSFWRWQWESNHSRTASDAVSDMTSSVLAPREERGALLYGDSAGIPAPDCGSWQTLVGRPPVQPDPPPDLIG